MNYISIMKVFIGLVDHSRGIIQDNIQGGFKWLKKIQTRRNRHQTQTG